MLKLVFIMAKYYTFCKLYKFEFEKNRLNRNANLNTNMNFCNRNLHNWNPKPMLRSTIIS